jgi:metallophosphoesterase (TIGR00282 family)
MPSSTALNVLFVGDIVARPGRRAAVRVLPGLVKELEIDLTIANCENVAGGFGLTKKLADELGRSGIDVMTSGNHIWDRREMVPYLDSMTNVLRPLNYPKGVPGRGWACYEVGSGTKVCVVNLMGRVFMRPIDCPFKVADEVLAQTGDAVVVVDMHAEATSEKVAMGWYLDGRVSAVFGSHTHVQTADERILPKGTAYITDVGMTGPFDSVIGIEKNAIVDRFLKGIPNRFDSATDDVRFSAAYVSIDRQSHKATEIRRIHIPVNLEEV